jgi:multicomponent Na+:H+ antiporter subunit F
MTTDVLLAAAGFLLAIVGLGLIGILGRRAEADRMMAAQLTGTGGVAILLLLAEAAAMPSVINVALMLAMLAAFAAVAFVKDAPDTEPTSAEGRTDEPRA